MTVSLVTGKFKVLHIGHLRLFNTAAGLSQKLIVALDTSDLNKDEIEWRINLISNISQVNEVRVFAGDVTSLIKDLKPDFVVKGSEFSKLQNIEETEVAKYGGKLVFSSGNYYYSDQNSSSKAASSINHHSEFIERRGLEKYSLVNRVKEFSKVRVCVIGDLIVDEYIECKPIGMSQENPAIVVTSMSNKRFVGGAGVLAKHCVGLGAKTTFLSVVGNDEFGVWAQKELGSFGLSTHLLPDLNRKTTLKTRYTSGSQVLFRLNNFSNEIISSEIENKLMAIFKSEYQNFDVVIFSDFSYGLLSEDFVNKIIQICISHKILVVADSQSSSQIGDLSKFRDIDLITPTEREARLELKDETSGLVVLAEKLRSKLRSRNLILKLGSDGVLIHALKPESLVLFETDQINALNSSPVNISGAGDSLLAGVALALASESDIYESSYIGSMVAAIHISQNGNIPINSNDLLNLINKI